MDYLNELERKDLLVKNHLDELNSKKVLLRVDLNGPVKDNKLIFHYKVDVCSKLVAEYVSHKTSLIILTHQGRRGNTEFKENLEDYATMIESRSGISIDYVDSLIGEKTKSVIKNLRPGDCVFLPNVRSSTDETELKTIEEKVNSKLVKFFTPLIDLYVNDAIAVSHRDHTSLVAFPQVVKSFCGLQTESELKMLFELKNAIESGEEVIFLVGGKKFEKMDYLLRILSNTNVKFLVGGIPGQLITVAKGIKLNLDNERFLDGVDISSTKQILKFHDRVFNPLDFTLETRISVSLDELPNSKGLIMDIGPETTEMYREMMKNADVCIIAGPTGVYELGFNSIFEIIKSVANSKTFILGGHSSDMLYSNHNLFEYFVSNGGKILTCGGAALAFLAGKRMPGIEAIINRDV